MTSPNGKSSRRAGPVRSAGSPDDASGEDPSAEANGAGGAYRGELVDADRLMRLRARLQAVRAALADSDAVTRRRVSRRVEHIATLAPEDLDEAEAVLDRLEEGMTSKGLLH